MRYLVCSEMFIVRTSENYVDVSQRMTEWQRKYTPSSS